MEKDNNRLLKTGIPGFNELKKLQSKLLGKKEPKKSKDFGKVEQYISQKQFEQKIKYINETGRLF
jgi:hypothetical protein